MTTNQFAAFTGIAAIGAAMVATALFTLGPEALGVLVMVVCGLLLGASMTAAAVSWGWLR